MKSLVVLSYLFASVVANAGDLTAKCVTSVKDDSILSDKVLMINVSRKSLTFKVSLLGTRGQTSVSANFLKMSKNGDLIYDGSALKGQVDQVDMGFIFLSPSLLSSGSGNLTVSLRQLGDSEGYWWAKQTYKCVAQ